MKHKFGRNVRVEENGGVQIGNLQGSTLDLFHLQKEKYSN